MGPIRIASLVRRLGSARAACAADIRDLAAVPGIGPRLAVRIARRARGDVDEELRSAAAVGARLVTWCDAGYPPRLWDLRTAPPVVYLRGGWDGSPDPAVAIVGTRRPSPYGLDVAGELGEVLGAAGVVVISGLARGIDRAAHAGALRRGGRTVAVLASGVDIVYPPEHRTLMEAMLAGGGVVSEVPMGVHPQPPRFPLRNRLISGMAQAVVVVEGGVDSGSLITARHAVDQQRALYAVPGSVFAPGSRGPHQLLAEGAKVLRDPRELLERLGFGHRSGRSAAAVEGLTEEEARVLRVLGEAPAHIDEIIGRAGLGAGRAAGALAALEVRGLVRQWPGKRFARRSRFEETAPPHVGGDTWPNHSLS